jgi:hypothetical protein
MQLWDGYWLSNVQGSGTGGATSFYVNDSATQELSYSTGADSIDVPISGIAVNMIPKDGGNQFHGLMFADYTHLPWSASNLSPTLLATGLTNVSQVYLISDFNPGFGGPIKQDKLWFYTAFRYQKLDLTIVNSYYDADPRPWVYTPNTDSPGHDDGHIPNGSGRLTWQISSKDKISGWMTAQFKQRDHFSLITGIVPDALALQKTPYAHAQTVRWQRTQTSKLLFEAGFAVGHTLYEELYRPENAGLIAYNDISSGLCYNNYCPGHSEHHGHMEDYKAAATYVTGSHALKGGIYVGHGVTNLPIDYSGLATLNPTTASRRRCSASRSTPGTSISRSPHLFRIGDAQAGDDDRRITHDALREATGIPRRPPASGTRRVVCREECRSGDLAAWPDRA